MQFRLIFSFLFFWKREHSRRRKTFSISAACFFCFFLSVKKVVCDFEGGGTVRARVWLQTEHDVVWRERERERERESLRERA